MLAWPVRACFGYGEASSQYLTTRWTTCEQRLQLRLGRDEALFTCSHKWTSVQIK